jgi:hypothetical protein
LDLDLRLLIRAKIERHITGKSKKHGGNWGFSRNDITAKKYWNGIKYSITDLFSKRLKSG